MKLRHTFLIALGVAVPLWVRQQRFEQGVVREIGRFTDETVEAHTDLVEYTQGTLERFVKELNEAVR